MSLANDIENSLNQAVTFLEGSYNTTLGGFPHYAGKERITEYGGTSSGLAALSLIDRISPTFKENHCKAKNWLISKQAADGSWCASSFYCCEVTAGILAEFGECKEEDRLPNDVTENACKYIKNCFNQTGYFMSVVNQTTALHIYTTYIAVRALMAYDCLTTSMKQNIISWVKSSKASDDNWGEEPNNNLGTVVHTAMALYLLYCCDYGVKKIKKEFKKQLRFIKKNISGCGKYYEHEEITMPVDNDTYGKVYHVLHITHYGGPILSRLFMVLSDKRYATVSIMSILKNQFSGGWGSTKERRTMWATQQAVSILCEFKTTLLKEIGLGKFTYRIPYFTLKLSYSIMIVVLVSALYVGAPPLRGSIIIMIISAFVPWFYKRYVE